MQFFKKSILLLILVTLVFSSMNPGLLKAATGEVPALVLNGTDKASAVLKNMDFTDVKASNTWAKSAIYESSALELMKGNNRSFGLNNTLSVEQAIAIAYNIAGREGDAQREAEALDLARANNARLFPAPKMWSDGYIQLAFNEGILTQQEYNDAFNANQQTLAADAFHRLDPATREDVAYYVSKVLGLAPVYPQTHIFNSYNDWDDADPHRIPSIEALLQNKIMNGDTTNGVFKPKGRITRAEMAQIIINAEPVIFEKLGFKKFKGTVEAIEASKDSSNGQNTVSSILSIRSSNGELHQLTLSSSPDPTRKNELTGQSETVVKSSVVNRNNALSLADTLKINDPIAYIVNTANEVPYIEVVNGTTDIRYYLGRVTSVDPAKQALGFSNYGELPFQDVRLLDQKTLGNMVTTNGSSIYSVSRAAKVYMDGKAQTLAAVSPDENYVITLKNGVVDSMERVSSGLLEEAGVVSGIVKEVNPSLGYITLYFEDGTGTSGDSEQALSEMRTYTYAWEVPIYRDGKPAAFDSIKPGDYAFIKLDEEENIATLSAKSYYAPVYGTVFRKGSDNLVIKKADGSFQTVLIPGNTPILINQRAAQWKDIKEGQNIRLLIQNNAENTDIASIELTKSETPLSAIYRGQAESFDPLSQTLNLSRVQAFVNDRWEESPFVGVKSFEFSKDYPDKPASGVGKKAYLAVKKEGDGKEKIVFLAYRAEPQFEASYHEKLLSLSSSNGRLTLENVSGFLTYDAGTLAVRDGLIVDMTAMRVSDTLSLSTEANGSANLLCNVVIGKTTTQSGKYTIYRGRIQAVDPLKSLTLESFAELKSMAWQFSNTPKTLTVDVSTTRLMENDGLGNIRNFNDTFKNQSVTVVAEGSKAVAISTAAYADQPVTGRIESLVGGTLDDSGKYLTPPTGVNLKEVQKFNLTTFIWEPKANQAMTIPVNAVVIKDGLLTDASMLMPGDNIQVMTHTATGNGMVILVQ